MYQVLKEKLFSNTLTHTHTHTCMHTHTVHSTFDSDEKKILYYRNRPLLNQFKLKKDADVATTVSQRILKRTKSLSKSGEISLENCEKIYIGRLKDLGIEIITQKRTYFILPKSVGECVLWTWILKHYVEDVEVCRYEKPDSKFLEFGLSDPSSLGILLSSTLCIVYFSVELLSIDITKSLHDKSLRYEISIHALTNKYNISSWEVQRSYSEFVQYKKSLYKADSSLSSQMVHDKLPRPLSNKAYDEEIDKHLSECENFLLSVLSIPAYRRLDETKDFFYIKMAKTSIKMMKSAKSAPVSRRSRQRFSSIHAVEMPRRRRVMSVAENL